MEDRAHHHYSVISTSIDGRLCYFIATLHTLHPYVNYHRMLPVHALFRLQRGLFTAYQKDDNYVHTIYSAKEEAPVCRR